MKVKTLIKALGECNPESIIILSKDSEGNRFSPLSGLWEGKYSETDYGSVGLEELTPALEKSGFTAEDILPRGRKAVILCPRE
jgi:hypothetical protein